MRLPWPFTGNDEATEGSVKGVPIEGDVVSEGGADGKGRMMTEDDNKLAMETLTRMLDPFRHGEIPLKARTDPTIPQKDTPKMTLGKAWQYIPFLLNQGGSLTKAFVSHHLWGPPKPSWGIELTLFTAMLRQAAEYSHLSSIDRLRSIFDLASLLPTPKDGIVTPISFRVKKRGLRGLLAEADAQEDGKRQIKAEWVINKRLWRKMQNEFAQHKSVNQDRVILYLHGGAYFIMSPETHRFLTISVSRYTESRLFAVDYRLAPETRFPGQLHDAVSAYMRLIIDLKIPPENIIIAGDSAGGGLTLATMMYLRDEGYPLPSAAILMSPWCDLTMSCESWTTNGVYDYLPQPKPDDHLNPVKCFLGAEGIHKYLTHPYASPIFGDFTGLPPMLIQAGDAEVLRDEITLVAHKASLAGVTVEHEIFEDSVHVFQAFLFLEASRKALQSQRHFVKYKLVSLNTPKDVNRTAMDAEITADAHRVDERGKAAPTSLPSSPIMQSSDALPKLPDGSPAKSKSTLLPGFEDDEDDDELDSSPSYTPELERHSKEPTYASDTHQHAESTASSSSAAAAAAAAANGSPSRSNGRPMLLRNHHGAHTVHPDTRATFFSPSVESDSRPLRARSSSHPDLRDLVSQYEASGPAHRTRIYRMTQSPRSNHSSLANTPESGRSRQPSLTGEALSFSTSSSTAQK